MKTFLRCIALLLMISASVHTAYATSFTFGVGGPALPGLRGPNENPINASPAIGTAIVTWDNVTHIMTLNVSFSGLTPVTTAGAPSGTTASHIHCCITIPNGNAGVATQLPSFVGFPLGVNSGSFSGSFDMSQASSYNPAYITANGGTPLSAEAALLSGALAGNAYLNIHTNAFPGGEIRGFLQVSSVPEPMTVSLLGTGLFALAAIARRARR